MEDYERIGGLRFSGWHNLPPRGNPYRLQNWTFHAVVAAFLLVARWIAQDFAKDPLHPSIVVQAFKWLVLVGPMLAMVVVVLVASPRRRPSPAKVRPEGVPDDALPVRTSGGDGWLWLDGPFIVVSAEQFSFQLRARDVKGEPLQNMCLSENPWTFNLPEGLGRGSVNVVLRQPDPSQLGGRRLDDLLAELSARWAAAAESDEESVFPPVWPPLRRPSLVAPLLLGTTMVVLVLAGARWMVEPLARWYEGALFPWSLVLNRMSLASSLVAGFFVVRAAIWLVGLRRVRRLETLGLSRQPIL